MKKRDLEKSIARMARQHGVSWVSIGGSKHDKFTLDGVMIMIPRHREIDERLAKSILNDCVLILASIDREEM